MNTTDDSPDTKGDLVHPRTTDDVVRLLEAKVIARWEARQFLGLSPRVTPHAPRDTSPEALCDD